MTKSTKEMQTMPELTPAFDKGSRDLVLYASSDADRRTAEFIRRQLEAQGVPLEVRRTRAPLIPGSYSH